MDLTSSNQFKLVIETGCDQLKEEEMVENGFDQLKLVQSGY